MKKILQSILLASILLIFNCAQAQIESVSEEVFSLSDVKLGTTTIDDIQAKYGKAPILQSGKGDGSPKNICYSNMSSKGKAFVIFESGPMGGFKRVTGFRITTRNPGKKCPATDVELLALTSGNGVQLRQSRNEFLKKFSFDFKRTGGKLVYEGESKREATKEELDRLRTMWPNEKQTFFDVTINVRADFKGDRLIDYYVSRIESY